MAEVSTILVSKDYVDSNLNPIAVGANPYRVMLDNWYFGNPINQNGLTEYTGLVNKVSVDRWLLSDASLKVIVDDGFITLTNQSVTTGYFYQYFDNSFTMLNLPLTVSCLTADGALYTGNKTFTDIDTDNEYLVDISATLKFGIKYFSEVGKWAFVFHCHDVDDLASINILAVKAEYGNSQTLATQDENGAWTPITLPNYAEELAKCVQYDKTTGEFIGLVAEAIGAATPDYVKEQIKVVAGSGSTGDGTSTDNTKMYVSHLHEQATVDGQTEFAINLDTFNEYTDTVHVQSNGLMLFPGEDFTVSGTTITLTEGVPVGRDIGIYVYQNVTTDESGNAYGMMRKLALETVCVTATEESQTVFPIGIDGFDEENDTVLVQSGRTSLFPGMDFTVVDGNVVLTTGVPVGVTIGIYVYRNVVMVDDNVTISGERIEQGSIPLDRLVGTPDVSGQITEHNTSETAHEGVLAKVDHTHNTSEVGISWGTTDLTAGTTALANGKMHLVYE